MNIEKQVLSLPIAQRLKALGVNEYSYFVWCVTDMRHWLITHNDRYQNSHAEQIAAYTVPELAELLGDELSHITCYRSGSFCAHPAHNPSIVSQAPTMADALGLLLERVLSEVVE